MTRQTLIVIGTAVAAFLTGLFAGIGLMLAVHDNHEPHTSITVTNTCPAEDGDPSGQPCIWTDPDTGNKYVVDSSEYR